MNEELNKKLAKWAGWDMGDWDTLGLFKRPDDIYGEDASEFNFTESLDACFKWLVPKLQNKGYMVELYSYEQSGYKVSIYHITGQVDIPIVIAPDREPAQSLCKAIEQLIDRGE